MGDAAQGRLRWEERFPLVDFDDFHQHRLPRLIGAGNGSLAARDLVGETAPGALALRLPDGSAYTYRVEGDSIAVEAGSDDAETVVEMDAAVWSDLAQELQTVAGLCYQRALTVTRGRQAELLQWEVALRALYHGRPPYNPDSVELHDLDGAVLDPLRAFRPEEGAATAHFLEQAGYAVVRDVLTSDEIAALRSEADRLAAEARPGDKRSWWAKGAHGEQLLCRITYAGLRSERIELLNHDPRIRSLVALSGRELAATPDRIDGDTIIIKNHGVSEGLSDLPWHVDCGIGGHAIICPALQVSIFLEGATEQSGNLRVLPGSWHCATRIPSPQENARLPAVSLVAEPGDCVLHYSDTLHAAPPPTRAGACRRSLVLTFVPPHALELIRPGEAFNDVLLDRQDGHVRSI